MAKSLERKAYSASLTAGVVILSVVSLSLLVVAAFYGLLQESNRISIPIFVFSLAGGVLGFFGSLFWYVMKAREYVRAESVELDLAYPGFYDYCQQRLAKMEEITAPSNYP
jgi:Na+/glutamate symporter